MPRGDHTSPGRALILLALIILAVLAIYDLNSPHSLLASAWHTVHRSETKGEILRDDIMDRMKVRR